jgi:hypothetical protein
MTAKSRQSPPRMAREMARGDVSRKDRLPPSGHRPPRTWCAGQAAWTALTNAVTPQVLRSRVADLLKRLQDCAWPLWSSR